MDAHYKPRSYKKIFIPSMLSISLVCAYPVLAREPFNPLFLETLDGNAEVADLSVFADSSSSQLPGIYRVNIYVNGESLGYTQDIRFIAADEGKKGQGGLQPCLDVAMLKKFGVRTEAFPAFNSPTYKEGSCVPFTQIIPMSSAQLDFNRQQLNLSFPQSSLDLSARGYVDPAMWDEGIPAALVDYNFSGNRQFNRKAMNENSQELRSNYLNLRSGVNFGAWRLRNYSTWQRNNSKSQWDSINTYAQRNIIALKSQLTVGDSFTPSEIFDSVQYRGVQMGSDDSMYPDSQRGFAPVVRGIAQTNAQITIRQNGYVIYQTYVAPGAFVISDLSPTTSNGDLEVSVTEADGRIQRFIQPFSSLPIMQREGQVKYNLVAGEYRMGNQKEKPGFAQATLMWGGPRGFTAYGGILASNRYDAFAFGVGKNLAQIGAISADVTFATTDRGKEGNESGQSYRFLYAKSFADSGTDLRIMGYRYSTSGFYTFQESTRFNEPIDPDDLLSSYHRRSQIQAMITQRLGEYGSVYLSASRQDYWAQQGTQKLVQAGYNGSAAGIAYGLSYSYSSSPDSEKADKIVAFNMSVPLDRFMRRAWATYDISTNRGQTAQQAGISGTLLEDNNLTYNVQQSYANRGVGNGGNASLAYQGTYANTNIGYHYNRQNQQINYSLSGGVIAHENGITLSQSLGDTNVLVKAPGADHTRVVNNSGVTTDWRGYAVVPSVTPYRQTRVGLDPSTLSDRVELLDTGVNVVPTRGAIVRAEYGARVGYRIMMTIQLANGQPIPFGAMVTLLNDRSREPLTAIVGDDGQTYLSGLPEQGILKVTWGQGSRQSCQISYQLPAKEQLQKSVTTLLQPQRCL